MKIKSVSATWLHVPIPKEKQHVSDFGPTTSFDATLVRIETECGIVGHGEAKSAVGSNSVNLALCTLIEKELGPQLIGQDPRDISRLWDVMYNGTRAHFALDRGHVFPALGRRGLTISGIAGIDLALWDILGKSLNAPIWRLLRAVKMRVGSGDGEVRHSIARVRAAREGLGDDIDIMCDAHGTMNVPEAKRFCREVADCNIAWFEEPVTADDKRGLAEIRASTDIPIATGESEFTRFDFRDLIELRAADILQPDLAIAGGISEAMRIEALCSAHQLRFAAHLWTGALAFAAGLHVSAVASSAFILEYSLGANPLLRELSVEEFVAVDGFIEIPDRPGLGVTINEDFVKRYARAA